MKPYQNLIALLLPCMFVGGCAADSAKPIKPEAIVRTQTVPPAPSQSAEVQDFLAGHQYDWSLSASRGQCRENWSFGTNGIMTNRSGEEISHQSYRILPRQDMMVPLELTRIDANGAPDCMGNRATGPREARIIYLMRLNNGGFFTCSSTDTMSCFGGTGAPRPIAP